jgi:hypothetical protein
LLESLVDTRTGIQIASSASPPGALPQHLLKTMLKLGILLKGSEEKWAIGGDAGEIVQGVSVTADHIEILTTKKGCEAMSTILGQYQTLAPTETEKMLGKDAVDQGVPCPAYVKSEHAEFLVDGVSVEVYGDLRVKVGERDWSDPLEFEVAKVNLVGKYLPVVSLELSDRVYRYLGPNWGDRVQKISEAIERSQPNFQGSRS